MPPNEPPWGKKNNEGPPDLDEMLRKFQQKLAGLFGGRRPGSGGSPPNGNANAIFNGSLIFIALLIVAVWLASGFYIVDEGRRGVVFAPGQAARDHDARPALAHSLPDRDGRGRQRLAVRTVEVGYRGNPRTSSRRKRSCSPTTRTSSTCSSRSSTR
jgi:membrane protease subunit HflK